jgi:hypothetical protein
MALLKTALRLTLGFSAARIIPFTAVHLTRGAIAKSPPPMKSSIILKMRTNLRMPVSIIISFLPIYPIFYSAVGEQQKQPAMEVRGSFTEYR